MDLKKIIADYLRDSADAIESNTCGLNNAEIMKLATLIMHLEMNKTEAANFLNMSTRTFDRRIEQGEIPPGIKVPGSNQLIWFKDEIIEKLGQ